MRPVQDHHSCLDALLHIVDKHGSKYRGTRGEGGGRGRGRGEGEGGGRGEWGGGRGEGGRGESYTVEPP